MLSFKNIEAAKRTTYQNGHKIRFIEILYYCPVMLVDKRVVVERGVAMSQTRMTKWVFKGISTFTMETYH